MARRRRRVVAAARPAARRAPVEVLEVRVLFAAVHNTSFDVTGLTALRADAAYSSITGAGIGIAVLDSGVDVANPDLTGQVVSYYNAVESAVPATAPAASGAVDADGHGTHVSGIAASADPGIGVAYGAHLVDVKVIADANENQLSGDPLLRGLQFVAEYAGTFNIKVVNMSLGEASASGGINDSTAPAADDISREIGVLQSMGITVVAADGNSYANSPTTGESYPAIVSTIAVGSTWSDAGAGYDFNTYAYGTAYDSYAATEASAAVDRFSATSQRSTLGNFVVAPGVDVYSDWNGSSSDNSGTDLLHNTLSGTSMATPFISGTVALMQQAALTYGGRYITDPEEVLNILRATADHVTDSNVADNGRVPISNGALVSSTVQDLPETGATYDRVNVLAAIRAVQALFTGTVSNADTDDTTATATTVASLDGTAVQTLSGTVGTDGLNAVGANDVDLYKVTLTSTGALTAALSGSSAGFTADVRVFDASGNQIPAAVGTGTSGYPTVTAGSGTAPLATGVYYVGVSSAGDAAYSPVDGSNKTGATGGTGDYQLALTLSNPDPNGVVQGAVAVDLTAPNYVFSNNVVANQYLGTLGSDPAPTGSSTRVSVPNGDVDMFAVVAPDTGTVTAQAIASAFGASGSDTFVEVFTENAAGTVTVVGSNGQASNVASDSQLQFPVTLGQTYYVAVTVYGNRTFSPTNAFSRVANSTATQTSYDLYLTFNNGNANGTLLRATAATVGATAAGSIASTATGLGANGGFKYVNWYQYTAPASGLLDLTATATATTAGFTPNVQLWMLTTAEDGSTSVTQVGGVTGSGQSLMASVLAGDTVYVSVTGAGNQNFNWYSLASGSGGQTGAYAMTSSVIAAGSAAAKAANDDSVDAGTPAAVTTAAPVAGDVGMDGGLVVGASDVDLYAFTPTVTGAYDVRTGTSQEGSADTLLRLFNADGTQVASNDNADGTTTASFVRADLVAGTTYYIGVSGSGNAAYDPITGTGATDATKTGLYTLAVSVATVPAISVAAPAAVNPTAASSGTTTLAFVVSLDQPAAAAVTVDYATADGTAVAGTDYTATSGTLTFAPGQTSATVDVPVLYDANNTGTVTFTLVLSGASSNALLDGGQATGTITNLPVTQLPFGNGKRATYADAAGHRVTVSLAGGGTGVVSVVGSGADETVTVATTGTTARSNLSVAVAGGTTTIDGLQVTGSLSALAAAAVDLAGDLTVTGTIRSLVLAGASGGHTLSIGGAAAVGSLRLGNVSGLTVATAEPLASLFATSWANAGTITAPSVRSLTVPGSFAASLAVGTGAGLALGSAKVGGAIVAGTWKVNGSVGTLSAGSTAAAWSAVVSGSVGAMTVNGVASGSLMAATVGAMRVRSDLSGATVTLTGGNAMDVRSLTVGGSIAGSTVRAAGSIGAVRARAVTGSTVFAGVSPAVAALPTSAADFAAAADILSFTVTGVGGTSFADSDVAAATLGRVAVRNVSTANGGTAFGFAADTLASFTDAEPGVATFRYTPRDPATKLAFAGDFAVRVFGAAGT